MEGAPFGRYRLIDLLGRGGMGEVWRAYDSVTDRIVALKVLPAHLAQDQVYLQRFRHEAHVAARLNNPHVIPIHVYGEIDGRLYVDMRLIEGRDLQAVLADGPLEPTRAVRIIEQVASALQAAHKVGLVHRDVKPSNILLDEDDFAYLIDFGIARGADETRMTGTGSVIGSLHYMSPERLQAGEVDARADIYALACVLYECLTGEPPYPGNLEQQITAHLTTPPPRPSRTDSDVPVGFDSVIAVGMAKSPEQRYPSTVELARAARDAVTTPISATPPAEPVAPTGSWAPTQLRPQPPTAHDRPNVGAPRSSRGRIIVGAGLAAVLVVGGGIFAAVKFSNRPAETNASKPAAATAQPPGPLDGTFTAEFGKVTDLEDGPLGDPPDQQVWSIRSACPASGCVATASRVGVSDKSKLLTMVLDEIDGRWVAVAVLPTKCNNIDKETWAVYTLQSRPDGTLSGEQRVVADCISQKSPVTFTRTGDVFPGVAVADPNTQPPRVASPAQGLHGRYHDTITFRGRPAAPQQGDPAVGTDCLRAGDRCVSVVHGPEGRQVLIFANGNWTRAEEYDNPCAAGGTTHVKVTGDFPLPQPPQNPITVLTGHGYDGVTGSACTGGDFDETLVRTGD